MATKTLTEQQQESFTEQAESAIRKGDTARIEKMQDQRTPNYRADELHYRKDYGATMDDQTYGAVENEKKDYESRVALANKTIADTQSSADSQYRQGQEQINSASLPASNFKSFYDNFLKTQTTPIAIYKGNTYEGTYVMDNASASEFLQTLAKDGFFKVYKDDNGRWAINNKGYGKELHESLLGYTQRLRPAVEEAYNKQYREAANALNTEKAGATDALNTMYSSANQSLTQQRQQVEKVKNTYNTSTSNIRFKYQNKLKGMSSTAGGLKINNG